LKLSGNWWENDHDRRVEFPRIPAKMSGGKKLFGNSDGFIEFIEQLRELQMSRE
jgi:hypothetical protein